MFAVGADASFVATRRLHRRDYATVCVAAADVPGQGVSYLRLGWRRVRFQQRDGAHQESRCAESALSAVVLQKGGLNRVERLAIGQSLDGADATTGQRSRKRDARVDRRSVEKHGAGAALAPIAAALGACKSQNVAQDVEQRRAGIHFEIVARAVYFQSESGLCMRSFAALPLDPPAVRVASSRQQRGGFAMPDAVNGHTLAL